MRVIWLYDLFFFCHDLTGRTFLLQAALAESSQFKEKLMTLQLKKDVLNNVLGEEKAESFLQEVAEASKEREILHKGLLQSKSKLQVNSPYTVFACDKDKDEVFTKPVLYI